MDAADPIDPGIPLPSEPWAADILPLLPFERRGAKLYRPGAVATLAGRDEDAAALEARLAEAGVRTTKVEDDELARFLEASGRLVRLGDGYAIGPRPSSVARDVLLSRVPCDRRDLARRASVTSSERDGVTRSSSSSASTRTGSRGAYGERRVLRRAALSG